MAKWQKGPGSTYGDKLKDPRWQQRRLEIMGRDGFTCQACGDKTIMLAVHHRWYEGEPWEAPNEALVTLCENCHENERGWRQEIEQDLLAFLKKTILAQDLEYLRDTLSSMPAPVLDSLAAGAIRPDAYKPAEAWLRKERKAFDKWSAEHDARRATGGTA